MEIMSEETKIKHPPALYMLALTASWERFSYYGMRAFLILYMANAVTSNLGGMGFSDGTAGRVYGIFTGLCYLFPLVGGYLADRFLGERRSVLIGAILIMLGHFTCAIDNTLLPFISGLTLLIIGNGFFKPTVVTMVGDLYQQGDKRRDSAFTIYYMLFNAGVFLAPILCGYFGREYGYRYGFVTAGFGMMLGLTIYIIFGNRFLGDLGKVAKHTQNKLIQKEKTPLTKQEKDRISVILVLLCFVIFFWAGYEQAGGSFNLYTERYINRTVMGWEIPTEWFQSVNPLFVVALSPLFSWLWMALQKRGKNPSTPVKMGIAFLFLGIGFLFMVGAVIQRGGNGGVTIKAGLLWLLLTYLFHTVAELCLSPIGLSMVTKLAPLKLASLFVGVWFLSSFVANTIAGFTVEFVDKLGAKMVFGGIALLMLFLGLIVFFISRWLLGRMHGRD
ncbi:MAG: peptide MFS transporter [Bacteroidetes bacterium]|nr:peptide MFS transporter [Bacteroidota bacterium]